MPRAERAQRFLVNPHAWLDDPAVQAMTLEARGAYASLWLAGWDQKEPGVYLADDRVLAQLARCTPEEWVRVRPQVFRAFSVTSRVTERDTWKLPGFGVTLDAQSRKRDMDRNRQQRNRLRQRDVTRDAPRDSLDGSGSGSGTDLESKEEPSTLAVARSSPGRESRGKPKPPMPDPPDWLPPKDWLDWIAHRKAIRHPLSPYAAELTLSTLASLRQGGHDPVRLVRTAIERGWRGIFPTDDPPVKLAESAESVLRRRGA